MNQKLKFPKDRLLVMREVIEFKRRTKNSLKSELKLKKTWHTKILQTINYMEFMKCTNKVKITTKRTVKVRMFQCSMIL